MGRNEMRWEELRWDELRWGASVKCGVWGVKSAMWSVRKVFALLHVALHRCRARVMFLDNNTATASHKARTHGPGWRTAHASSLVVVLGSDSSKLRWHMRRDEMRWAGIRWEELRWDEARSVKSAVWSVGRDEECSVKCEVWSVKNAVRSEKCEVWTVKCGVWSVKFGVRRVQCEVWSVKCGVLRVQCEVTCWVRRVQCEVWSVECEAWSVECEECSVKCEVWSLKCEVELQMWHVKQDTTFAECTHARAWLVHGACKFYRWESSYISLRQLPPRLVRVLLVNHSAIGVPPFMDTYMSSMLTEWKRLL